MHQLLFIIFTLTKRINIKDDPSLGESKVEYPVDAKIQKIDHIVSPKMPIIWINKNTSNCILEKNLFINEREESTYKFEYSEIICSDGTDLSNLLSNLDDKIQSITIKNELDSLTLDLNELNHKIEVKIIGIKKESGNSGEDEEESDLKLLSKMKSSKRLTRSFDTQQLKLVGNIKDKVYNLLIENLEIEIIDSPLNINSLTINSCTLNSNTKNIEAIRFIICPISHMYIIKNNQYDKIHVGQFTVKDMQNMIKPCYYINYYGDYCELGVREYENENDDSQKNIYSGVPIESGSTESFECKIPYSCCEMVALLAVSHFFHFTYQSGCTKAKTINITMFNSVTKYEDLDQAGLLLQEEEETDAKYKVYISSVNNWDDKVDGMTTVYLTGFLECIDIDTSMLHKNIEVNKFSHYLESGYDPDKDIINDQISSENQPSETIDDSVIITPTVPTDTENEGSIDINEIEGKVEYNRNDINGFLTEVTNKFSKDELKENVTNVLLVTLPTEEDTYEFTNLNLSENQYLKLDSGSKVNLNGGNLNVIFDQNSIPSSIKIGENINDVNLSILNLNEATLNINSVGEKRDILIKSKSVLQDLLKVNADNNIKTIIFDSIVLRKSGKIQNDKNEVVVKVSNLFVESKSDTEINGVEIDSHLNVSQTSHLTVTNSKIEQSSLNIFLSSFDVVDYTKNPILTGNFIDEPKQINLFSLVQEEEEVKVQNNVSYLLIEGVFTSCINWTNKISFGNTQFTDGVCSNVNTLNADDEKENEFLFVKKVEDARQPSDEKKKKLSGGAIAGIVIGCVAAVAIIVVVVVVFVVKKKGSVGNASSTEGQ